MLRTSESTKEINTALATAQKTIDIAIKDTKNPFFGKNYADLSSVWKAVKQSINDNNICVIQSPGIEVLVSGAIFVSVDTRLGHISGEWIEGTCLVPPMKQDPQAYGSAITYARRYALAAFLGVIQDDDDAEGAMNRTQTAPAKQETPAKKPARTAPEKPGPKDSPKSGVDLKARIQPLNKLMKELGAKTADDCELILLNCRDGVIANPTWAEVKENPEVNVVEVENAVRGWLKANGHLKGDEVIQTLKMMVTA